MEPLDTNVVPDYPPVAGQTREWKNPRPALEVLEERITEAKGQVAYLCALREVMLSADKVSRPVLERLVQERF